MFNLRLGFCRAYFVADRQLFFSLVGTDNGNPRIDSDGLGRDAQFAVRQADRRKAQNTARSAVCGDVARFRRRHVPRSARRNERGGTDCVRAVPRRGVGCFAVFAGADAVLQQST